MRFYDLVMDTPDIRLPENLTRGQLESCQRVIQGYTLGPGVHLGVGVCFSGVDLQGMSLRWADLLGCDFRGANFRNTDLRGANLGLTHINGADFSGADMRGTNLAVWPFEHATFSGARYNRDTRFPKDFDPKAWGMVLVEG